MTNPIARDLIYRRRVFDAEIIEPCVRWYVTYRLTQRRIVVREGADAPRTFGALQSPYSIRSRR
jgi:hypothetical protein